MALLTKAQIIAADDIRTQVIDVPEWGEGAQVKIKAWSVAQADAYGSMILNRKDDVQFIAQLRETTVSMSIVNEDGSPMFTAKDMAALGKKSPAAINRVHRAALELNKLGNVDEDEEKND